MGRFPSSQQAANTVSSLTRVQLRAMDSRCSSRSLRSFGCTTARCAMTIVAETQPEAPSRESVKTTGEAQLTILFSVCYWRTPLSSSLPGGLSLYGHLMNISCYRRCGSGGDDVECGVMEYETDCQACFHSHNVAIYAQPWKGWHMRPAQSIVSTSVVICPVSTVCAQFPDISSLYSAPVV